MIKYYGYDNEGRIVITGETSSKEAFDKNIKLYTGVTFEITSADVTIGTHYYDVINNVLDKLPIKPNEVAKFNYATKNWDTDSNELAISGRKKEYPPISEQLDMLYHAMKNGDIPIAQAWVDKIDEVKNKYPKEINNG